MASLGNCAINFIEIFKSWFITKNIEITVVGNFPCLHRTTQPIRLIVWETFDSLLANGQTVKFLFCILFSRWSVYRLIFRHKVSNSAVLSALNDRMTEWQNDSMGHCLRNICIVGSKLETQEVSYKKVPDVWRHRLWRHKRGLGPNRTFNKSNVE